MSSDKTKITMRINNAVYDYFKDKKNYQNQINNILENYVADETSDSIGTYKIIFDGVLQKLTAEARVNLDALRQKIIPDPKREGVMDREYLLYRIQNEKTITENISLRNQISQRYDLLINDVAKRMQAIFTQKYQYRQAYFDDITSHKEESSALIVYHIQLLERYFIGDLYYKDTQFSLKTLEEDDYKIAVIRMNALTHCIIDTTNECDHLSIDVFNKIINEQNINKKKILEFVFYPIFEMAEIEKTIKTKIANLADYSQVVIYNVGLHETFEAQILLSYLIHGHIHHNINVLELIDKKHKGIDMSVGIEELLEYSNICDISTTGNITNIVFNPAGWDEMWEEDEMPTFTIQYLKDLTPHLSIVK